MIALPTEMGYFVMVWTNASSGYPAGKEEGTDF
jgi:hypothetical protein